MPIRFRCYYCDQLMGIARRKAGTVVVCPKCKGQVVVPSPEPDSAEGEVDKPAPSPGPALFEQSDLERILQQDQPPPAPPPPALEQFPYVPTQPQQLPAVPSAMNIQEIPMPMSPPPAPAKAGIFLSPAKLALLIVLVLVLLAVAFFLGLQVGKDLAQAP